MLIAQARVPTIRAQRYLDQLCGHLSHLADGRAGIQVKVEWSGDHGLIDFGSGSCTVDADADALTLRVQATDRIALDHLTRRIADRLQQFGHRDGLSVTWRTTPHPTTTEAQ
jgi:hypothetical protein